MDGDRVTWEIIDEATCLFLQEGRRTEQQRLYQLVDVIHTEVWITVCPNGDVSRQWTIGTQGGEINNTTERAGSFLRLQRAARWDSVGEEVTRPAGGFIKTR